MKQRLGLILIAILTGSSAGCATTDGAHVGEPVVAAVDPAPPVLTPDQEAAKAEARQVYVTCLKQAADYITAKNAGVSDVAALIAPMCYPQFERFEAAAAAGMDGRGLRAFDRKGDQRQLEFAADAVRQQHGLAALSSTQ
jgi:hypothetical protein